ncbi:MAG: hypothetical protein M0Q91_10585 [Methanoregula sp.]|jgi:hypothetical protein|nr:hypothetical protein [Methanoregula sp.]
MASKSLDFTLDKYEDLCKALAENSAIYTVSGYLAENPKGNIVIMRHDVDRKINNSLNMAKREHEMGIRSSYYFRYPSTFKPDIITKIRDLGHETGYHYEVLSKTKGDFPKAIALFETELAEFRKICPVDTICMHGSPLSKYNNRDLWKQYDYHSFGIRGEAFLSFEQDHEDIHYLTDTGRTWSNKHSLRDVMKTTQEKNNPLSLDTTDDLIAWLSQRPEKKLYITVHPERWSSNYGEWLVWSFLDFGMNIGKKMLRLMHHD